jgi:hypothetical protein
MSEITQYPKRIHLLGSGRHEEATAGGAITPGMLLKVNSVGQVIAHDGAAGVAEKAFALEDALQGRTINTAYAQNELVGFVLASPGDVVYAFLGGGENVNPGATLNSNGDGTLQAGTTNAIAIALEAVNASDSNNVNERIRVRIL